ncbi:MAG: GIY-YIG nuclease family protein [Patescibacteria group bacterium]|nr:GIY-YIG nuclease family protein [Patescibacteria group bacterium]
MGGNNYYVYIMTSISGVLYIGVTNDLRRRVIEHKNELIDGFTKKYKCHKLVYYEYFTDINYAIRREKELKGWKRIKKIELIKKDNYNLIDLFPKIN